MALTPNAYGAVNPQIIDPYPGELALTERAFAPGGSALIPQLVAYRNERNVNTDNYMTELAAQHEFAKQNLAATIAKNQLEALPKFAEHGILDIGAQGPLQGALTGVDPRAVAAAADLKRRETMSLIMQRVLEASQKGAEAGTPTPAASVNAMVGAPVSYNNLPLSTINKLIDERNKPIATATGSVDTPGGRNTGISIPITRANAAEVPALMSELLGSVSGNAVTRNLLNGIPAGPGGTSTPGSGAGAPPNVSAPPSSSTTLVPHSGSTVNAASLDQMRVNAMNTARSLVANGNPAEVEMGNDIVAGSQAGMPRIVNVRDPATGQTVAMVQGKSGKLYRHVNR